MSGSGVIPPKRGSWQDTDWELVCAAASDKYWCVMKIWVDLYLLVLECVFAV